MLTKEQKNYNTMVKQKMKEEVNDSDEVAIPSVNSRSYVICSVCKKKKGCDKNRFDKLLKEFGSIEEIDKKYVCRSDKKK